MLVALAPELASLKPSCDVWLVATGSEERDVTGLPYHAGAAALVKQVKAENRSGDLRFALSVDEIGLGRRFYLRSPHAGIRDGVHREFELAGLPGAVLEVWKGVFPCHHMACDRPGLLQKPALDRALRIAQEVVTG